MGEIRLQTTIAAEPVGPARGPASPVPLPSQPDPQAVPATVAANTDKAAIKHLDSGRQAVVVSLPFDESQIDKQAQRLIDAAMKPGRIFGQNLDAPKLGQNLAQVLREDPAAAQVAARVLSQTEDNQVINALLASTTDASLKALAGNDQGKAFLRQAYTSLNALYTTPEECRGMQRIMGVMSERYGPLATFEFNPPADFNAALKANNSTLQKLSEASRVCSTRYDHYEATVSLKSPEQALNIFKSFAADLNNVGDRAFDLMENFTLRGGDDKSVLPKVGDIYDIDILGPDNGAVMVGSSAFGHEGGHFSIVTITEKGKNGLHPENGVREFGFTNNKNGTYTFYTTGASRGLNNVIHIAGGIPQEVSAKGLIQGFVDKSMDIGGKLVKGLSYDQTDPLLK